MKTDFEIIYSRERAHEGFYVNDPDDAGKETYCGIARSIFPDSAIWPVIDQWKEVHGPIPYNYHIPSITLDTLVDKHYLDYWDACGMNMINSFSVKYILFDFAVNSVKTWAKKVQEILGFTGEHIDGIIGPLTCAKINSIDPEHLFNLIKHWRIQYYEELARKGRNWKFREAWLARIGKISYER